MNNFDADLNYKHIDENLDMLDEACNTCMYDLEDLTIVEALPSIDEDDKYRISCHLSLLSRYATKDRMYYRTYELNAVPSLDTIHKTLTEVK